MTQQPLPHHPPARRLQDQSAYGTLTPRLREVAEEGWAKFVEGLAKTTTIEPAAGIDFLELEITRRCQLTCGLHCYAEAGPTKGHGSMTVSDWESVITEAAAIGVSRVQLIGGEPTLHPDFAELVEYALAEGLQVQVYSNLYQVQVAHWPLFERPGVSLATSYYADTHEGHDEVTGRTGSHTKTRANIIEALRRGIRVQVGIVDVVDGQRVDEARQELLALGVKAINVDRVRGVGNAARVSPSASELCGRCARGRAAIMPDGAVTPCVLARFLSAGDTREHGLATVLNSSKWAEIAATIPGPRLNACPPDDSGDCDPANTTACDPSYE
ncbi:radical SAM protein [Streptomyces sp. PvR034]|uniref:radical SAM protein n=1 Tax=Streptomyces sp. PvR034 TaxID=3156401 RepID=UPI003396D82C